MAAAVIVLRSRGSALFTSIDYGPEDIAYDKPIQAVHEMEAGPAIPFLPKNGPQSQIEIDVGTRELCS